METIETLLFLYSFFWTIINNTILLVEFLYNNPYFYHISVIFFLRFGHFIIKRLISHLTNESVSKFAYALLYLITISLNKICALFDIFFEKILEIFFLIVDILRSTHSKIPKLKKLLHSTATEDLHEADIIINKQTFLNPQIQKIVKKKNFYCFSDYSTSILKKTFEENQFPSIEERKNLAEVTNLTYEQVSTWFYNRQRKSKQIQE